MERTARELKSWNFEKPQVVDVHTLQLGEQLNRYFSTSFQVIH